MLIQMLEFRHPHRWNSPKRWHEKYKTNLKALLCSIFVSLKGESLPAVKYLEIVIYFTTWTLPLTSSLVDRRMLPDKWDVESLKGGGGRTRGLWNSAPSGYASGEKSATV